MVVYQPPAHPFGELWNTHRIAMSFILDELVIKLSEDFAVFKFGYPMTHELRRSQESSSHWKRTPQPRTRRSRCGKFHGIRRCDSCGTSEASARETAAVPLKRNRRRNPPRRSRESCRSRAPCKHLHRMDSILRSPR